MVISALPRRTPALLRIENFENTRETGANIAQTDMIDNGRDHTSLPPRSI